MLRCLASLPFASLLIVAPVALTACGGNNNETSSGSGDRTLVVLFTSDEHSHVFAFSPELDDFQVATTPGSGALLGGIARRATVLKSERDAAKAAGKDSLTVSAGDNQMGGLSHVAFQTDSVDYGTMAELGYDVTTLGNHEFDFGPGALAKSLTAAKAGKGLPPIVASNIHFSTDPADDALEKFVSQDVTDDALIHPYRVIVTPSGLRVGFVGWVGVNAEYVAPNKTPVRFSAVTLDPKQEGKLDMVLPLLYADLQPVVDKLRKDEHADIVIGLSHGGIRDESTMAAIQASEDYQVALNVKGLDLIVSGHAHNPDPTPFDVAHTDGTHTLVLNASCFGKHVGRVELTAHSDPSTGTSWDKATQALLPVDDETLPDADVAAQLGPLVEKLEEADKGTKGSFLEALVSTVDGMAVQNDATKPGDLYFAKIGHTSYDVTDTHSINFLSADSMLAQTDALMTATDMGLESAGVIRNVIKQGKSGDISVADAFSVVPLGGSPVDGSVGYPLVRAYISGFEMRAVLEASFAFGPTDSDFDLGASGIKVEYDKTRPPIQNSVDLFSDSKGQVMKILLDTNHTDGFEQYDQVIYDRVAGIAPPTTQLFSVVTSSYIAQFASSAGVTLKDQTGAPLALKDAILHRADGSEVKQFEAFLTYLKGHTPLPSYYDPKSAQATTRLDCIAGCQ